MAEDPSAGGRDADVGAAGGGSVGVRVREASVGAAPSVRRTRPATLREVVREVELMERTGVTGPVSLLASRLAERGVRVGEAALRAGECRAHLERVWKRRRPSASRYGPTGGYDLLPVGEIVERILETEAKLARVEADIRGEPMANPVGSRDPRSLAVCARKEAAVAARAALIPQAIRDLARAGSLPCFRTVAERLTGMGHPITSRTLRRIDAYSRPILVARGEEPPTRPHDPRRRALANRSSEELGAMLFRLIRALADADARFEATLD